MTREKTHATRADARAGFSGVRTMIGIFDSGTGGLTVLQEIRELLPGEDLLYFADTARLPYGEKELEQIRTYAEEITAFLLERGARMIVVASNTASAASLYHLRERFPGVSFVGMEPAVKPAVKASNRRKIGILATVNTLQGQLLQNTLKNHAAEVEVFLQPGTGLVEAVENADHAAAEELLRQHLRPLLEAGADVVVLGCTHYSWLKPLITQMLTDEVIVIDPAPAVAKRVAEIWDQQGYASLEGGKVRYFSSGPPSDFREQLRRLLNEEADVSKADLSGNTE